MLFSRGPSSGFYEWPRLNITSSRYLGLTHKCESDNLLKAPGYWIFFPFHIFSCSQLTTKNGEWKAPIEHFSCLFHVYWPLTLKATFTHSYSDGRGWRAGCQHDQQRKLLIHTRQQEQLRVKRLAQGRVSWRSWESNHRSSKQWTTHSTPWATIITIIDG